MGIFSWLGNLFGGKRKKKKQPDVDYLQPHPGSFESERKEVAENRKLSDPKVISMDPTCDDSKINGEGTNNSGSQIVSSGSSNRKDEKKISFEGKTSATNASTIEERSSSNSDDVQTRVYNFRLYLIDELKKMGIHDEDLVHASDEILLQKIREGVKNLRQKISQKGEEINNLKSKKEEYEKKLESEKSENLSLREKQSSGKNEKDTLTTEITSLRKVVDNNEKTIGEKNNLIKEQDKKIVEQDKKIEQLQKDLDNLNKNKIDLENQLAQKSKLEEEIASSNAGQLSNKTSDSTAEINQSEPEIDALKKEDLEKATEVKDSEASVNKNDETVKELTEKLSQSEEKLSQSEKENEDLKTQLDNAEKEINDRTNEKEELSAKLKETDTKLKNTEGELAVAKEKLKKTEEDLKNTEVDLNASLSEIETLSREKKNLESDKAKLSKEKNDEIEEKNKLTATLKNDISSLLATYKNAADSLMKSLDTVFIKECNEDEETDTVESMCQKICSDAEYVASEIDALKEKEFNSTADLEKAYKDIIADNIESLSFTEIARWWAYSRLPFVLDTSREGGRSVELSVIEDAYAAVERLLALAGFRYHLPILFVQNLTEGEFENLTGSEQLNLSYHVPNVTSHVGKIDREDCENVILDIVKLGYYEGNQLVKKTSVIVQ